MDWSKLSNKLRVYIYMPFISTLVNLWYWSKNIKDLYYTIDKSIKIKREVTDIEDASEFMGDFDWNAEKIDWKPWVITAIHKYISETYDDCDGAAVLWKWLFRNVGYDAEIWHLRGKGVGHAVTITKDKEYMGSNSILYKFRSPNNWKEEILDYYFDGKYDYIFK